MAGWYHGHNHNRPGCSEPSVLKRIVKDGRLGVVNSWGRGLGKMDFVHDISVTIPVYVCLSVCQSVHLSASVLFCLFVI